MPKLDILIAAYGPESLENIARLNHPKHPGVRYIVGWQKYDVTKIPECLKTRSDFKLHLEDSIGLCNNRNSLLNVSDAPLVLISDDDLEYSASQLENLLRAWEENPDAHFLTFRYHSDYFPKHYPKYSFNLKKAPKGYFVTSMELSLNIKNIRRDFGNKAIIRFDTKFGINGSMFGSGEEDLLIAEMLKLGLEGKFIPEEICTNTDSTTSERIGNSKDFISTKGAVISIIKPNTWILRMLTHAWRATKQPDTKHISFFTYCKWWISGVNKIRTKS